MWCHFCDIDFDNFKDFKKHILEFHGDCFTSDGKAESKKSDYQYETPVIDIKDEPDIKSEIVLIEDQVDIEEESNVLNTPEKGCNSNCSTARENKSSNSRASLNTLAKNSYISNESMTVNAIKEECPEKGYDSNCSMARENKSSDSKASLNTLAKNSYVSNENMTVNGIKEECSEDVSPQEKHKRHAINKTKFVSELTDLNKLPKKRESLALKKCMQENKESFNDSSKRRKLASYQSNIYKNSSATATKRSDRLLKKSNLNSQPPLFQNSFNTESSSTNILNTSLKKLKQHPYKNKPVSKSNISKKLLKKPGTSLGIKKQVQKKKPVLKKKALFISERLSEQRKSSCEKDNIKNTDADKSISSFIHPQPHTSSNYQFETDDYNSHPITNNIPIVSYLCVHKGVSNTVLNFLATHSARLKDMKGLDFNYISILNWLRNFKESCKNVQYPLSESLFNTLNVVHTAIFDLYSEPSDIKKGEAVLKVYKELGRVIHNHLISIKYK